MHKVCCNLQLSARVLQVAAGCALAAFIGSARAAISSIFLSECPGDGTAWIVVGMPLGGACDWVWEILKTGRFCELADGVRKQGLQEKQMSCRLQMFICTEKTMQETRTCTVGQDDQSAHLYAVTG